MKRNLVNSLTETQGFEEWLKTELFFDQNLFYFDIYIYIYTSAYDKQEEESKTATTIY